MNKIIIVHYEEDPAAIEAFEEAAEHLWYQHVNYTRQAIVSILGGLEDTQAVIDRLMKNQEDLGKAIAYYYGDEAAAELTRLLKNHISTVVDIARAVKEDRSTAELEAALATNAEAIAVFLDDADAENWPKDAVLSLLKKHIECTLKQATSRKAKEWTADIAAYEECCATIHILANAFYKGIVNRFPEAFVKQYMSKTIKKK